jgi:hypothetical protein
VLFSVFFFSPFLKISLHRLEAEKVDDDDDSVIADEDSG